LINDGLGGGEAREGPPTVVVAGGLEGAVDQGLLGGAAVGDLDQELRPVF
jgi:hypothetical protein